MCQAVSQKGVVWQSVEKNLPETQVADIAKWPPPSSRCCLPCGQHSSVQGALNPFQQKAVEHKEIKMEKLKSHEWDGRFELPSSNRVCDLSVNAAAGASAQRREPAAESRQLCAQVDRAKPHPIPSTAARGTAVLLRGTAEERGSIHKQKKTQVWQLVVSGARVSWGPYQDVSPTVVGVSHGVLPTGACLYHRLQNWPRATITSGELLIALSAQVQCIAGKYASFMLVLQDLLMTGWGPPFPTPSVAEWSPPDPCHPP